MEGKVVLFRKFAGLDAFDTGVAAGITLGRLGDHVPLRSLAVYQAIGSQLAAGGRLG